MDRKELKIKIQNQNIYALIENSQAKKAVILVHGFSGDLHGPDLIFDKLTGRLIENNFAVVRFNFRGTYPSDGTQEEMSLKNETADLNKIISWVEKHYSSYALVAESFAGAVTAAANSGNASVIIFWYPLFHLQNSSFKRLLTKSKAKEMKKNGFIYDREDNWKVGSDLYQEIKTVNTMNELKKLLMPVLILHGDSDKDVPLIQSQEAIKLIPDIKELGIIDGADHCFRNEQGKVIDLTMEFLSQYS